MIAGRILLADDEPLVLDSTAELLRQQGYVCETAGDAATALALAQRGDFDLLITDLEMPGNADMALVRELARTGGGLPIIIMTGFPSVRSAVASIDLPVVAYLTKPVDLEVLQAKVSTAILRYRTYCSLRAAEAQLGTWRRDLEGTVPLPPAASEIDVFLTTSLRAVMGTLSDVTQLGRALQGTPIRGHACQLLNCPRGGQLLQAVQYTITVLEETRGSFKSKQLADLRHQLELLVHHV